MIKAEFPYLADWFAISLRWFTLLGMTIALTAADGFRWPVTAVLLLGAIWNVFMSMVAVLNRRLPAHRTTNVVFDLLIMAALYALTGGLTGTLNWASILVLLSAAIYFEWRGGVLLAFLVTISQVALLYLRSGAFDLTAYLIPLGLLAVFNFALGIILGLSSGLLMNGLRKNFHQQVRRRREVEKKAQKVERSRMQAFYQLIETLSSTLNYNVVLSSTLDLSQSALDDLFGSSQVRMVSAVMLFADQDLVIANARGLSPSDAKRSFPAENGILRETIRLGEAQVTNHPTGDPEIGKLLVLQACKSAVALPLSRGLDVYGVMLFAHPEENYFTPEKVELLAMISRQSVVAIQNARLYQQLEQEKEMIVETQEEARKKLARDLHDGPTQSVSAIAMRLNIARKMMELSPEDLGPELERIEELARRTTSEIRHMLFTMRPLVLESEGLIAALKAIAEKTQTTYQQKVRIDAEPEVVAQLDAARQTVVFYLVEEAVNNARKHAQAELIWVRLRSNPADRAIALLEIIDNGIGFDVNEVNAEYDRRGSLGMVNLRERTQLVNGLLHIDSVPGRGTRVQIYIPLNREAAERIQHGMLELQES